MKAPAAPELPSQELQTFRHQVVSAPRRFGPRRFDTKTFRHQPKKVPWTIRHQDVSAPKRFGTKTFRYQICR